MGLTAAVGSIIVEESAFETEEDYNLYLEGYQIELQTIQAVLKEQFNYTYHEPKIPVELMCIRVGNYHGIHQLREFAVGQILKFEGDLRQLYQNPPKQLAFKHLINHEEYAGYYFPCDFGETNVLWVGILGSEHSIGSSVNLKRELKQMLSFMKWSLPPSDGLWYIWRKLYRLCVKSIVSGCPIIFG